MKDISVKLIQHHGSIEDEMLYDQFPFLQRDGFGSPDEYTPREAIQASNSIGSQLQNNTQPHSSPQEHLEMVKHQNLRKTKRIAKTSDHEQSSAFSSTNYIQRKRRPRKSKQEKAKPYPTKNFLPNFKGPHLQFLQKYLQKQIKMTIEEFYSIDIINQLGQKNGISLEDYQRLYRMKEFSKAFEAMFECQYLYRELLLSRSIMRTKKIHMRKLYVFEEAFRSQKFEKINY